MAVGTDGLVLSIPSRQPMLLRSASTNLYTYLHIMTIEIIKNENGEKEIIKNANDFDMYGEVMVIRLGDMETRLVRPLSGMISYRLIGRPGTV